jgi:PEGA domain
MRTTVRARCIAALVSAAVATAPLAASAQTAPATAPTPAPAPEPAPGSPASADTVTQARSHFAHGVKLYEEEDYRAALIEFSRAYELAPNWAVLYNVGQSHYQLRDYPNALRTLEKYVREGGDQIAKDRRAEVDREMDELRGRVAHVALTSNAPGAELSVDDVSVGKTPLGEAVLIGAGRHKLAASKPGYMATTKVVDIAGGDNLTLALDLAEEPHQAASQPAASPESPNYVATVLVMGVGVAGVAVGTIFGAAAIGNKSSLSNACDPETKLCPPSEQGDLDAFSRNGAISTVGFGVGIAGLVLGTYLLFHERSKEHATPDAAPPKSATITPWMGLGSAGLAGTF